MVVAPNGFSFVSSAYVPNTNSVAHFLLVDFGGGYLLLLVIRCDRGKQSQLLLQPTKLTLGLQV